MIGIKDSEDLEQIRLISKEQLDTLYKISKTLNSAVFENTLINDTLDLVIKVINAERGLVVKYDELTKKFTIVAARNFQQESIEDLSVFSSGILQRVIEKKLRVSITMSKMIRMFHSLKASSCIILIP